MPWKKRSAKRALGAVLLLSPADGEPLGFLGFHQVIMTSVFYNDSGSLAT